MPRLACRELGGDCDFVAEADTAEEVKALLLEHAEEKHRIRMTTMSRDEREALDVRIDQFLGRRH